MAPEPEPHTRWRLLATARTSAGNDAFRALEVRLKPDFRRAVATGAVALSCLARRFHGRVVA